ncbi:MAG: UvrD-helicase domain-containing protein [Bacteroidales bacterium]|nr:UvrD-helicase domain-containing protein [Bacteroidales bacterium]
MGKSRVFNSENIELKGLNLVEASAGTGKTYSIAILVLRLVIEKKVPLEKILMVTFTKAAVAELETRIRRFVRQAFRYASGKGNADTLIAGIVDRAGKEISASILKPAVQNLDELSVMTIHSFCEKCLMQYPFETGQSFDAEISTDITSILDFVVNDYWRREINTLEPGIFQYLTQRLSREGIRTVVAKILDDKVYLCTEIDEEETLQQIGQGIKDVEVAWHNFERHVTEHFTTIVSQTYGNRYANDLVQNNCDYPQMFMDAFVPKCKEGKQYISSCFPQEEAICSSYFRLDVRLNTLTAAYILLYF